MDSRLFYTGFRHALRSIAWDKHGENEYVLVGDGTAIDKERLQSLVSQTFSDSILFYPESRSDTLEIALPAAAAFIAERLPPKGTVTLSDTTASTFLQVHYMGVARTGRSQADNSFKPTPPRGAA